MFPRFDPDPLFLSVPDRNFRPGGASPSLDQTGTSSNSDDVNDAERDTDSNEKLPPLYGTDRAIGNVDHGAFEFGQPVPSCSADIDMDATVGFDDLLILLDAWNESISQIHIDCRDVDRNGQIGFSDLVVVLAQWGPCGSATGNPPQSITDCIERLGTSDPQTLAACIEAMMRLEEGN